MRLIPTLSVFSLAVCLGLAWRLGARKARGEGAAGRPAPPRDEGWRVLMGLPAPRPRTGPSRPLGQPREVEPRPEAAGWGSGHHQDLGSVFQAAEGSSAHRLVSV